MEVKTQFPDSPYKAKYVSPPSTLNCTFYYFFPCSKIAVVFLSSNPLPDLLIYYWAIYYKETSPILPSFLKKYSVSWCIVANVLCMLRLQRLLKQLQSQDSGQWVTNKVSSLERILGEISRILEKQVNGNITKNICLLIVLHLCVTHIHLNISFLRYVFSSINYAEFIPSILIPSFFRNYFFYRTKFNYLQVSCRPSRRQ